ncbi:MAG: hypothetical protein ABR950_04175 [Candidatus Dormibacteria bacterium]|jgi:hypothetical protein
MGSDTSFEVDPSTLETLSGKLSTIESQMSNIGEVAAQLSPADLGSGDVYMSLQQFHDNWSQGLQTISGNIATVTRILTAAAKAYGKAESNITTAAGGSS